MPTTIIMNTVKSKTSLLNYQDGKIIKMIFLNQKSKTRTKCSRKKKYCY